MKALKIVADENIPFVQQVFAHLGEVTTVPGRTMTNNDVADADILLVRSVTPVTQTLLSGSSVRFVGTCTIGIDHLAVKVLEKKGISWCNAPGCNADSVVQYVLSVMATLRPQWRQQRVGIVGCGNVGGRLYRMLKALGVAVHCYDPWLKHEQNPSLTTLDEVLASDIVCMHTPLVKEGDHPTWHLLDEARLQALPANALLINAGRGAVIDNQALKRVLPQRLDLTVALDVWEPEPLLDLELLQLVSIGTPHIAGYSYDGKVNGTLQVYQAVCDFLKVPRQWNREALLCNDTTSQQDLNGRHILRDFGGSTTEQSFSMTEHVTVEGRLESRVDRCLNAFIKMCFDVTDDDDRMRLALSSKPEMSSGERATAFDQLRKHYPKRREFSSFLLREWPKGLSQAEKKPLNQLLATLGIPLKIQEKND